MATLRLIKIVAVGNGAEFQPDPSGVEAGDRIHWNNETNEEHWLEETTGGFMTDNIPAGSVSNPGFIATQDVSYRCRLHPQEQGTITIVPAVVMASAMSLAAAAPATGAMCVCARGSARPRRQATYRLRASVSLRQGRKPPEKKAGGKKKNR